MHGRPRYAELRDYLRVVREQLLVIIALGLLFAVVAFVRAEREPTEYGATSELAVRDVSQTLALLGEQTSANQTPERLAALVSAQVTRADVVAAAIRDLKRRLEPGQDIGRVSASVNSLTNLVQINAINEDPTAAARVANAFARATARIRRREELQRIRRIIRPVEREVRAARSQVRRRQPGSDVRLSVALQRLAGLRTIASTARPVEIADAADVPGAPIGPRPVRSGLLGLLVGLTVGLVVAFLRDALDRRIRTTRDAQEQLDLPVAGRVSSAAFGTAGLSAKDEDRALSPADAEAFRLVRANVDILSRDSPIKILAVTSSVPEEGKSTVAAAYATAVAAGGRRVLLVEGDVRRPTLAKRLGVKGRPGLTDLLTGHAQPEEVLRPVPVSQGRSTSNGRTPEEHHEALTLLPAGSAHDLPAELLGGDEVRALLSRLATQFDLVVLDTGPVLAVADALELVRHADAVIFCVRAMRTTRDQASAGRAALARLPERLTALVVTGVEPGREEDYGAYYAYADSDRR